LALVTATFLLEVWVRRAVLRERVRKIHERFSASVTPG
jgi:hypothetical protein